MENKAADVSHDEPSYEEMKYEKPKPKRAPLPPTERMAGGLVSPSSVRVLLILVGLILLFVVAIFAVVIYQLSLSGQQRDIHDNKLDQLDASLNQQADNKSGSSTGFPSPPVSQPTLVPTAAPTAPPSAPTKDAGDCMELFLAGQRTSGVYTIRVETGESELVTSKSLEVYCEMTESNGWTVLVRRQDGSVDFEKTWDDYKHGFGDASGEYWIGNDAIHALTNKPSSYNRVRFDLRSNINGSRYAEYGFFFVADESQKYQLSIGRYSGNAGDGTVRANGMFFTTTDQDNDRHAANCATRYRTAWWHEKCYDAQLTGPYGQSGEYALGIFWRPFLGDYKFLDYADMKITYDAD